jgi:hypothetical protein
MSKKCRAYSESKLGLEPPDNRKAFYAGWDSVIKTWSERCEEHPDHQTGMISNKMIQARMQEEIDALRAALAEQEQGCKQWQNLTDDEIKKIIGPWGPTPIGGYTRKLFDQIEAALKEKNT